MLISYFALAEAQFAFAAAANQAAVAHSEVALRTTLSTGAGSVPRRKRYPFACRRLECTRARERAGVAVCIDRAIEVT